MSSSFVDRDVADDQQATNPKLVEELSQLNGLLRTIIADKGSQDAPPTKTEPSIDELVKRLKPDPARIHFNYQEIRTVVELLLPTKEQLQELREIFLGVFGIEDIGEALGDYKACLPLGQSTLQHRVKGGTLVNIPWAQVSRIEDLETRRRVTQEVKNIVSTIKAAWPPQVARRDDKADPLLSWDLSEAGCELKRVSLLFNGSGYLQTYDISGWDDIDNLNMSSIPDEGWKSLQEEVADVVYSDHLEDWERHRSLKIWFFYGFQNGQVIKFYLVAVILVLLTSDLYQFSKQFDITIAANPQLVLETFTALQNFTGPWLDSAKKFCVCSPDPEYGTAHSILLHFVFRYFSTTKKPDIKDFGGPFTGLRCDWEGGLLESQEHGRFEFIEKRIWLGIQTFTGLSSDLGGYKAEDINEDRQQFPLSTAVSLSEDECTTQIGQGSWQKFNILPCMEGSGIAAFLLLICYHLQTWNFNWNQCLNNIDSMLKVKIDAIINPDKLKKLMFDESFEISKDYFTVLQLLRIFAECIQQSMDDLRAMQSEFFSQYPTGNLSHCRHLSLAARRVLAQNWETVVDSQGEIGKRLLVRIDRKTEEVKSLRDGLLDATSLREASRGLVLSQYILVFTILTIFYLPLSFVATLFGMHLFDKATPSQNQVAFYISIILIALTTYFVSGYTLWRVSPEESKTKVKELFRAMITKLRADRGLPGNAQGQP